MLYFCLQFFYNIFFSFFFSVAVTSHPSNESELQIYRVLQRANLLSYYDTFIAQGKYHKTKSLGHLIFLSVLRSYGATGKKIKFLGWNKQFFYSCQKESNDSIYLTLWDLGYSKSVCPFLKNFVHRIQILWEDHKIWKKSPFF